VEIPALAKTSVQLGGESMSVFYAVNTFAFISQTGLCGRQTFSAMLTWLEGSDMETRLAVQKVLLGAKGRGREKRELKLRRWEARKRLKVRFEGETSLGCRYLRIVVREIGDEGI
jgi:hypothetical protein